MIHDGATTGGFFAILAPDGLVTGHGWMGGLSGRLEPRAVAVDTANHLVVAGVFAGTPGLGSLTTDSVPHAFVAMFDQHGVLAWTTDLGEAGDGPVGVALLAPHADVLIGYQGRAGDSAAA